MKTKTLFILLIGLMTSILSSNTSACCKPNSSRPAVNQTPYLNNPYANMKSMFDSDTMIRAPMDGYFTVLLRRESSPLKQLVGECGIKGNPSNIPAQLILEVNDSEQMPGLPSSIRATLNLRTQDLNPFSGAVFEITKPDLSGMGLNLSAEGKSPIDRNMTIEFTRVNFAEDETVQKSIYIKVTAGWFGGSLYHGASQDLYCRLL